MIIVLDFVPSMSHNMAKAVSIKLNLFLNKGTTETSDGEGKTPIRRSSDAAAIFGR